MSRLLILSSWVAHGHVGLSAAVPVVQALGHPVTQLPTITLSNHPGFPHVAGEQVPPDRIEGMVEALEANGWLETVDTVLTGYLPTPAHVALACDLIDRLRRGRTVPVRLVVDPVLGDLPKGLYLPEAVAESLRADLMPRADVLTPNVFELGWLSGAPVETLPQVVAAARGLGCEVLVTSPPVGPDRTGVLHVQASTARLYRAPLRSGVPHGVGDVFSALIAAGLSPGAALGHLGDLIDASLDAPHLRIAETVRDWTRADPVPASEI